MKELKQEMLDLQAELITLKGELEKLDGILNAKVLDSSSKVLRTLELDEKFLGIRLAEVRQMIEDLKKPAGGDGSNQ